MKEINEAVGELSFVSISDLKLNPDNTNKHSKDQIDRLAKMIEYYGWRDPIIVRKSNGVIAAGEGRYKAAKKLKLKEVPVIYQDFRDDDEFQQFTTAHNAISEWSDIDLSKLNDLVGDWGPDFDVDLLGLKDFEVEVADKYAGKDADAVPEVTESVCKPGDLWILGDHRLLCGDSTNIQHVERLMNGEKADMVFTDPPYGVNYEGGHFHSGDVNIKRKRKKLVADDSTQIYKDVAPILSQFCDGPIYTWFSDSSIKDLYQSVESVGQIHAIIIWHKTNATYAAMNAQYKQRHEPCLYWKPKGSTLRWDGPTTEATVWEIKKDGKNNFHPTQKPVELAERAIMNHKAPKVLDLFGGSGSTLIACEKTNRKCFMMELDPHYCDVIIKRWEDFTGKEAKLCQVEDQEKK